MSVGGVPAWLTLFWGAWLLTWVVAARSAATTAVRQSPASRLAHGLPIWAGAVLIFLRPDGSGAMGYRVLPHATWNAWLGTVVVAVGLAYTMWARIHLGRFWSGAVTLKAEHRLIRSGPYA